MKPITQQVDEFIEGLYDGSVITLIYEGLDTTGKSAPYLYFAEGNESESQFYCGKINR
jgi:hypothetical protein